MNNSDKFHDSAYLRLLRTILNDGVQKGDRTGTGTISTFAQQMRFDISNGSIPLLTTKKMHLKSIIHELLWFLKGDTNIKYLNDNGVRIWDEWADEYGNLGPVYGAQWSNWEKISRMRINYETDPPEATIETKGIDQIAQVIDTLRTNPNDRRMIVSAWNVADIEDMKLPPCPVLFQFYSRELTESEQPFVEGIPQQRALSCHLYQRSCDTFLGVPFNIAQYSILVHMIAQVTDHVAEEFIWTGGDVHLYNNHIEQVEEQLRRPPYPSPSIILNPLVEEINDFKYEDFTLVDYNSHGTIKGIVSV